MFDAVLKDVAPLTAFVTALVCSHFPFDPLDLSTHELATQSSVLINRFMINLCAVNSEESDASYDSDWQCRLSTPQFRRSIDFLGILGRRCRTAGVTASGGVARQKGMMQVLARATREAEELHVWSNDRPYLAASFLEIYARAVP